MIVLYNAMVLGSISKGKPYRDSTLTQAQFAVRKNRPLFQVDARNVLNKQILMWVADDLFDLCIVYEFLESLSSSCVSVKQMFTLHK